MLWGQLVQRWPAILRGGAGSGCGAVWSNHNHGGMEGVIYNTCPTYQSAVHKSSVNSLSCGSSSRIKETKLSYRKQIARQLCTQYVDGIYDNPMTLKYRLTVTQSHWKQNH